jgi:hypothetical protein
MEKAQRPSMTRNEWTSAFASFPRHSIYTHACCLCTSFRQPRLAQSTGQNLASPLIISLAAVQDFFYIIQTRLAQEPPSMHECQLVHCIALFARSNRFVRASTVLLGNRANQCIVVQQYLSSCHMHDRPRPGMRNCVKALPAHFFSHIAINWNSPGHDCSS